LSFFTDSSNCALLATLSSFLVQEVFFIWEEREEVRDARTEEAGAAHQGDVVNADEATDTVVVTPDRALKAEINAKELRSKAVTWFSLTSSCLPIRNS
jgi:hypothetical protein